MRTRHAIESNTVLSWTTSQNLMSLSWVKSEYFKIIIIHSVGRERRSVQWTLFTGLGWQRWIDEKVKVFRDNCNSTLSETASNGKHSYFIVLMYPIPKSQECHTNFWLCGMPYAISTCVYCSMFYLNPYECIQQTINELEHTANSNHFVVCRFYGDNIFKTLEFLRHSN